jgi:hypothetical protein
VLPTIDLTGEEYLNFLANTLDELLENMTRSNEILGWEGLGNRQLLCFFKA